ncbi:MAG: hypothetical protein GX131_19585 [candidate division WS1 bacterium]|jgi:hypothetical protein|nr:hypothetical protein [candidate division WS1 bacterium]
MRLLSIALSLLLICAAAYAQQAPVVTITTDPVPAAVNMLTNPGFEQGAGEDGAPVGWQINTAAPEDFTFEPIGNARTGEVAWRVNTDSPGMSGYIQQNVPVADDTEYRAWTWLRLQGGRYMMLLRGLVQPPDGAAYRFDQRTEIISTRNHWLAPLYLSPEHLQGPPPDEWILMPLTITAPAGLGTVQVWLGSYFTASEMHFDDTYFGPARCTVTLGIESESPIRDVILRDMTSGRPIFRDDAPGGVTTYQTTVPEAPIADAYYVVLQTAAGEHAELVLANQ